MTTIVCNREAMAADTRVTSSGPICHESKIARIGTSLYGMCGHATLCIVLVEWLRTARNRHQLYKLIPESYRDSVEVIELNPGGITVWDGWGSARRLLDREYATGSGAMVALALLKKGHGLRECVEAAIELDECTGGTVQVETLKAKRKR